MTQKSIRIVKTQWSIHPSSHGPNGRCSWRSTTFEKFGWIWALWGMNVGNLRFLAQTFNIFIGWKDYVISGVLVILLIWQFGTEDVH